MMDEVLSWPRRCGGENVRPSEPDNRAKTRKPAQQNFRYRSSSSKTTLIHDTRSLFCGFN